MDKQKIINALKETNIWWKSDFKPVYKDREIYSEIKKYLGEKQMIALTGLRRVGKTTLMLKIVMDKINSGFSKENIMLFSFDNFFDVEIKKIIDVYFELLDKDETEEYLLIFDEIQKLKGWEEQIKRIYDINLNFKIIFSGSESLFIHKKSRESLAGRIFEFRIDVLSFKEYLGFLNLEYNNLELYDNDIKKTLKRYLLTNGFPELVLSEPDIIKKYLKEGIIEKIIYRDIPQIFPIKDVTVLDSIFNIIYNDPGQVINIEALAKETQLSRQTVSIYLDYLEKSFLIKKLYNFSKNERKSQRKMKKYYPSIISPYLIENENKGKVLETLAVLRIDSEYFWRDQYKNEVDLIWNNNDIMPIEIKSGKIETKGIHQFMKNFNLKQGIILTLDKEETISNHNMRLDVIPIHKFLLNSKYLKN